MISVQIVTKNNEDTIRKTLESVSDFPIVIIDLDSEDNTLKIVQEFTSQIHIVSHCNNISDIRNSKIETEYTLFLKPYEILTNNEITENTCKFPILNENIITKETRLFKKDLFKFVNPIYESIFPQSGTVVSTFIYTQSHRIDYYPKELQQWKKKNPIALEPYYFESFESLARNDINQFVSLASNYLFDNDKDIPPVIMTKYYLSMVYLEKKDKNKAINNIIECLVLHPLMAEFWCLLGDVFLSMNDDIRAKKFYSNAIFFGKYRDQNDSFPIDLTKYEEYPNKMLNLLQ